MIMCYSEARGNASRALRVYRDRYQNHHQPSDARVITAAYHRVLNNKRITPQRHEGGIEVDLRVEEQVLALVERNPRVGTRTAAKLIRGHGTTISYKTVHKIKRKKPYKIPKVQALLPTDKARPLDYCRWILSKDNPTMFAKNGLMDRRINLHVKWHVESTESSLLVGD